jgi:thiol:disulfide interchange protein DsbA
MKRRDFAMGLGIAALLVRPARAAGEPVEGRDFSRQSQPMPVAVPGRIEVIEFFGFWCPHCNELEPKLEAWIRTLPKDVNFRRVPVAWQAAHEPYQRLYYALEALGFGEEMNAKVFRAVHGQGLHLEVDAGLSAFAATNGIDKAKLIDAMRGFSVGSKVRIAGQLWNAYHLDGVPTLAVDGRFVTSPEQAGGDDQALRVVDALIRKARNKGG